MCYEHNRKLYIGWDICIGIIILLGSALLIYSALSGDRYRFELQSVKMITYCLDTIFLSRVLFRMFSKRKILFKYTCVVVANLISMGLVFVFNNLLHYLGFSSRFGYPKDITVQHFIISDLRYSLGLGIFRYIIFFGLGIVIFVVLDKGFHYVVWNRIKKTGVFIFDALDCFLEKLGLLKLFGLDKAEENDDLIYILERLKEDEDVNITTQYTDEEVIYEIHISREDNG